MRDNDINHLINYEDQEANFSSEHTQKILEELIRLRLIINSPEERFKAIEAINSDHPIKDTRWNSIHQLMIKTKENTTPSKDQINQMAHNVVNLVKKENLLNLKLETKNIENALKSFFETYCGRGRNPRNIGSFLKVAKWHLGQGSPGDQFILTTLLRFYKNN